ncbi:MAG: hypothetical protein HGB35_01620 [Geobacteraceae bacterium]|nr:hypothetical protein [Geobacteraceae bacterium]
MKIALVVIAAVLFMVACPSYANPAEQNRDGTCAQQLHGCRENSRECHDLHDALCDEERSKILLWDLEGMHNMLQQPELRQEMLQHPHFLRLMMQNREMRQELLCNEQMMHEMLRNPEIHREVTRNREMVEELENNDTYRHINQEHQADILEGLLLESAPAGGSSHPQ